MKNLKNAITKPGRESQPWAVWIWNLNINKDVMIEQLNSLIAQGFGGIAIRPGRDMEPAFNSEEFVELFGTVLQIASEKKVAIRLAEDFSLPWSRALANEMNQSRKLRAQQLKLTDIINPAGQSVIEITDTQDCYVLLAKLQNNLLNLADVKELTSKNANAPIVWKVQDGEWKIFVFRKEYTREPAKGYIPNVFNPRTAQVYIQNVLEALKPLFVKYVPTTFEGFLNEMPAVLPADNTIPWDDDLVVKFRGKYKKELIKLLPALFYESCTQAFKTRQQIYTFLLQSMYERFASPLEAWAKKNRISQWVLCPERNLLSNANGLIDPVVPSEMAYSFVGLQNLDGTDQNYHLLRTVADTNANQYRRETVLVVGRNRAGNAGTVQSLKCEFDKGMLAGTSKVLIDGCYFNVDQRSYLKTPFNPAWYAPGWEHMKPLCGYMSRAQEMLKDLHWNRQVAVLSPSAQMIAGYVPSNNETVIKGNLVLQKVLGSLERSSISYDIVNEEFLNSCTVRTNGEFGTADRIRKGNYQLLLIPYPPFISREVLSFVEKLLQKDGNVIFLDEAPKGTTEDGVTASVTSRIEKITTSKKGRARVVSTAALEESLNVKPIVKLTVNGKAGTDIYSAWGASEGYDVYLIHNTSDTKEYTARIELPESKHFAAIDCETGDIVEIDEIEKEDSRCAFTINIAPISTFFIVSSSTRISQQGSSKRQRQGINPFSMPQRSYRIVFKDQWAFEAQSLNALPMATWNLRIGLSRESGGFSHFYESNFQAKIIPESCYFLLNGLGGLNGLPVAENQIEVSVNGARVNRHTAAAAVKIQAGDTVSTDPIPEIPLSVKQLFGKNTILYNIKSSLVKGSNRISIRTTGFVTDPSTILYPPLILGNFTVSKGQTGWTIDSSGAPVSNDSWTRHGYPYLSGTGVYKQSFEVPNDYKKLVLRFSQVSGTTSVSVNDKPLRVFNWHPMEIDITSVCEPKRNELAIGVLNTLDNMLRMNGRPSGLIGEVYLDVY